MSVDQSVPFRWFPNHSLRKQSPLDISWRMAIQKAFSCPEKAFHKLPPTQNTNPFGSRLLCPRRWTSSRIATRSRGRMAGPRRLRRRRAWGFALARGSTPSAIPGGSERWGTWERSRGTPESGSALIGTTVKGSTTGPSVGSSTSQRGARDRGRSSAPRTLAPGSRFWRRFIAATEAIRPKKKRVRSTEIFC